MVRFVALFALAFAGFQWAFSFASTESGPFRQYLDLNASAAAALLRLGGYEAVAIGTTIWESTHSVSVKRGCDGLQPIALLVIGMLVFPVPLRKRLIGAVLGFSALFALNLVRIITLFLCLRYQPAVFERLHAFIWPMAFILVAFVGWISWAHWSLRARSAAPVAPA